VKLRLDGHGKPNLEVGPPFGTDLIVGVASSVPLFAGQMREDETARTYLPAMRAAIEAAQRRSATISGQVLVVETVER
jgi:hypothetical protein